MRGLHVRQQWHGASSIVVLGAILGRRRSCCTIFAGLPLNFLTYRAELSTHFLREIGVCVLAVPVSDHGVSSLRRNV
jgi:hypothetical protein